MARHIFKPLPQEDFYVEFCSIVDGAIQFGSAEELGLTGDRLERTDANGTSSYIRSDDWTNPSMIYRDGGNEWFYILRQDLRSWAETLDEDGEETEESQKFIHEFDVDGPENYLLPDGTGAEYWLNLTEVGAK